MLNYDAILFDVDGTLIDSAPGIINTLKVVFDKMGVDTAHTSTACFCMGVSDCFSGCVFFISLTIHLKTVFPEHGTVYAVPSAPGAASYFPA